MKFTTLLVVAVAVAATACLGFTANNDLSAFPEKFYGYMPMSIEYDSAFFYAIRGDTSSEKRSSVPLVMWLQGGPGATSLFGDFLENGPVKLELSNATDGFSLSKRNHAWTKHANMLYVDNPIGTGFSYTVNPKGFSTTDEGIADNLVAFMMGFLQKHTEYQGKEFWVFCESYGGKMTSYFGAALTRAVASGKLDIKFKGVALGDGWVDPVSCMYSYGDYLKGLSQVNKVQADTITKFAMFAQNALEEGNGANATNFWSEQQTYISNFTGGINWYNSLYYYDYTADNALDAFLGSNFTATLGKLIPTGIRYNSQADEVFQMMWNSFMNDGVAQVQTILNAGYEVNVYSGQLDLIVDTLCTERWMSKLNWNGLEGFKKADREPLYPTATSPQVGAFRQKYKNLAFWQVMRAGHMVPLDNPSAAEMMFVKIIGGDESTIGRDEDEGQMPHRPTVHMRRHKKFQGPVKP